MGALETTRMAPSREEGNAHPATKGPSAPELRRAAAWLAWAVVLLLVPAFVQAASPESPLDFTYYLWTSAIPTSLVIAAGCGAWRASLAGWRRRALAAALAAAGLYLVVQAAWYAVVTTQEASWTYLAYLRWPEWVLRWASWCLWGACLPLWVVAEPKAPELVSPLAAVPGAEALTERERVVATSLLGGRTVSEVAEELAISPSSVATYRSRACEKLGVEELDEVAPLAAEPGRAGLDVTSRAAVPLAVVAVCVGTLVRSCALSAPVTGASPLYNLSNLVLSALVLAAPPLAACAYARCQGARLLRPSVSGRLVLVLAALFVWGVLVAGGAGVGRLMLPLGDVTLQTTLVAFVLYGAATALLVPHLLDCGLDRPLALDDERCLLYLRGRGAGELQAKVLVRIAAGARTPDICEELHVARGTVSSYRARGYDLLGVHSRSELADLLARDTGVRPSADKTRPLAEHGETSD